MAITDRRPRRCSTGPRASPWTGPEICTSLTGSITGCEGSILRVFFICGAFTGVIGTIFGVIFGCLFATYIDSVMAFINYMTGGEVWDPAVRGIYALPAKLELYDLLRAVALSLGLSFIVTIFPARRAARMNPVEALRYE